jgi:outer membrane protein OmpA-like peptidoglycan-associated protein
VLARGTSAINSNASSPAGRRLIYGYSASAGDISGNASSATLNTGGARPGTITATCNVADDRVPALTSSNTTAVLVQAPPPPASSPEIKQLESRLALHTIYFATARPTIEHPGRGLLDSQADILEKLAADFVSYLQYMPDAHLILTGHADPSGGAEYNKGLTDRPVVPAKNYPVEDGIPADYIDTKSFGEEQQLTPDQIKQQMADNLDLTPEERQQLEKNFSVLILANNRRVDITLSTTGLQSIRRYPFNAKDFLALVSTKGDETKQPGKQSPKKRKP